jgi:hypothetical protein
MDMNKVLAQGGDSHTQGYTKIKKESIFLTEYGLHSLEAHQKEIAYLFKKSGGMEVGKRWYNFFYR